MGIEIVDAEFRLADDRCADTDKVIRPADPCNTDVANIFTLQP